MSLPTAFWTQILCRWGAVSVGCPRFCCKSCRDHQNRPAGWRSWDLPQLPPPRWHAVERSLLWPLLTLNTSAYLDSSDKALPFNLMHLHWERVSFSYPLHYVCVSKWACVCVCVCVCKGLKTKQGNWSKDKVLDETFIYTSHKTIHARLHTPIRARVHTHTPHTHTDWHSSFTVLYNYRAWGIQVGSILVSASLSVLFITPFHMHTLARQVTARALTQRHKRRVTRGGWREKKTQACTKITTGKLAHGAWQAKLSHDIHRKQ